MSELYRIEQESLTAIADEVRILSGTTELMSPDAMVTNIEDANDEVNSQTGLLAQLAAALEGKAGGGGGSVETCTLTITADPNSPYRLYDVECTQLVSNEIVATSFHNPSIPLTIENIVVGSVFVLQDNNNAGQYVYSNSNVGAIYVYYTDTFGISILKCDTAGQASLSVSGSGGFD